jgi:hypothetical protein
MKWRAISFRAFNPKKEGIPQNSLLIISFHDKGVYVVLNKEVLRSIKKDRTTVMSTKIQAK